MRRVAEQQGRSRQEEQTGHEYGHKPHPTMDETCALFLLTIF